LREALIDKQGCVTLSLEAVALATKNLLRRSLPEQQVERRQLFRRLRQLRLIHYVQDADLDQADTWIRIRPLVINLVNNEFLASLRAEFSESDLIVDEGESVEDKGSLFDRR